MPAVRRYKGIEIAVGAFVLAGCLVLVFGIFMISGMGVGNLDEYHSLYANAAGIEEGTPVKYSGMLVGRVRTLVIDAEDPTRIRVTYEVRDSTPVTTRTVAKITKADLLGDPYIDLHVEGEREGSVASMTMMGEPIEPGGRVKAGEPFDLQATLDAAQTAVKSLSDLAALVQSQVQDVIHAVSRVLTSTEKLLSDENRLRIEAALEDLGTTIQDVRNLIADNRTRIEAVLSSADEATTSFRDVARNLDSSMARLMPKAEELVATTDQAVVEIRGLVVSVEDSLGAIDMQRVGDLLDNLDTTTRNLAELSRDLKERPYRLIRTEKPAAPRFGVTRDANPGKSKRQSDQPQNEKSSDPPGDLTK